MDKKYDGLICGNSDSILKSMVDDGIKVDLVLTDPPYNINKDFGNDSDKLPLQEFLSITKKRIELCRDLLVTNGSIIWFGIHHYIGFIQVIMYDLGLYYRRMNIWYYENGFSRTTTAPLTQYEPFLWFSKSPKKWIYNVDDVRVPYKSHERLKNPVYYTNSHGEKVKWEPNPLGAMRGDVWAFPTLAGKLFKDEKTPHPTQKPEGLYERMILASSMSGDIVLDPFLGSGTALRVCQQTGRKGIGIEINPEYIQMTKERLADEFKGFDSIDERMKRVPNDLNDAQIREEYIKNHIKWFLKNHPDAIDDFMQEVRKKYETKMIESNQMSLFDYAHKED